MLRNQGKKAAVVRSEVDHGGEFKVLILDIETAPNLAHVWGLWQQNVAPVMVEEWSRVICFAAKWYGKKKVMFHSDFHDGHEEMVKRAHALMDEAHVIVHYNGKAFDVKHLNREFLRADMFPPSPHKDIDLLTIARSTFKFPSNKLDAVSRELGVGAKVKHEGFELWLACMANDPAAWARMKKYNVGDIKITEAVYEKMRPWIRSHPHVGLYTGELSCCPKCGSSSLHRRGFSHTPTGAYQQYQCQSCGGYSRAGRREPDHTPTTRNVS